MPSYLLGLYEKSMPNSLSIEEKLICAKAAGYDYLELSIDETQEKLSRLKWDDQRINEVIAAQFKVGIPIKSICLSGHRKYPLGHPDPAVQARSLEIMEDAIILACKLGVRIIQIAGYDVYYQPSSALTEKIFAKNLALSVDMAAKYGVILAFETMETPFLNTVEKTMHWVNALPSPYLQVYPDVGNITNAALAYNSDVLADMDTGRGHIAALHLKESKPGVFREVPYGEGHVPFDKIIPKALSMGVGLFVGEFWHADAPNWKELLECNNKFLRRLFSL